mmetsp:Transcript_5858/g.10560  ORF Transcript_5858/g.10560 Transcript_5858/m.10560 type:complete len:102 (+) Transcript_5858:88-393(+)
MEVNKKHQHSLKINLFGTLHYCGIYSITFTRGSIESCEKNLIIETNDNDNITIASKITLKSSRTRQQFPNVDTGRPPQIVIQTSTWPSSLLRQPLRYSSPE